MSTLLKKQYKLPVEVYANKDLFGRKVRNYTAKLEGIEADGNTPEEAVQKLTALIGRMQSRVNDMLIVRWRDTIAVVRFDPREMSWFGTYLRTPENPDLVEIEWCYRGHTVDPKQLPESATKGRTERDIIQQMVMQDIIQQGWELGDGFRIPLRTDADKSHPFHPEHVQELARWIEFQLRYRAALDRGLSDVEAHGYAGRNPVFSELWAGEPREELTLIQGMQDVNDVSFSGIRRNPEPVVSA